MKMSGFTLIELMITLVILSILMGISVPNMSDFVKNNHLAAEANGLITVLNQARAEAIAVRRPVSVCRSNNGSTCNGSWNQGYIAFIDFDNDGAVDTADGDAIFISRINDAGDLNITYSNGANRISFNGQGEIAGFNGTFTICDDRGNTEARGVMASPVGRISAATDTDSPQDSIVNGLTGVNLVCT